MASERIQRRIDRLLDQIEDAADQLDWQAVRERSEAVLAYDPENQDAHSFLAAAQRAENAAVSRADPPSAETLSNEPSDLPTSFANGRYQVKRFLGEGGKKRVYLARDTLLDREVAFALIKTEGLDEVSRTRITREAQAMGRLGSHSHIVTVFDLGEHEGQPYVRRRMPELERCLRQCAFWTENEVIHPRQLVSGKLTVILEDREPPREIVLTPGRAIIVPRGVWHRVVLAEPSQLVYITPGPGGELRPLPSDER